MDPAMPSIDDDLPPAAPSAHPELRIDCARLLALVNARLNDAPDPILRRVRNHLESIIDLLA